tara:strand:+ start:907 stop:1116 length:210 start_codon:yes stop_codon:yes gene_type:complete
LDIFIQGLVFIGLIVTCAWWNYRQGMMQGIDHTLETLQRAGIIDMNKIDIDKAYKNTGTDRYRKNQLKE